MKSEVGSIPVDLAPDGSMVRKHLRASLLIPDLIRVKFVPRTNLWRSNQQKNLPRIRKGWTRMLSDRAPIRGHANRIGMTLTFR